MTLLPLVRPTDNRGSIRSGASRSVDAIRASGGVAFIGESERAKPNNDGEYNVFHF
jgi:hypothetical protein